MAPGRACYLLFTYFQLDRMIICIAEVSVSNNYAPNL